MTPFEEDVLFDCLENEVMAWEMLHDPQVAGNLNTEQTLDLCRRAGYSEADAQRAATKVNQARMERELPP